ncbi:MAG TPA: competence/damage-inducible protein A [Longimicrobiales bacterium]|nr:competence/damage-inducible protein A [Longimicrobiales bacterium]
MKRAGDMVRAAIVTVGDELLSGQTVDTNAAWLGRELAALGIPVARRHTVGDRAEEITHALADAMEVADLVLVTGGLGPTPDDITRDVVATALDRPLELDSEVLEGIRAVYRQRGTDEVPTPNRRVAQVPRGAAKLANPFGTAPGLVLEAGDSLVVLLPGVPRELKGIFSADLTAHLRFRFGDRLTPVQMRTVRTTGIPESALAQTVAEVLPEGPGAVELAFLPDERGVDLRMSCFGMSAEEAGGHLDALEGLLAPVLAPWRFDAPDGDLVGAVSAALARAGKTLALAESCTGGLMAKRVTDLPGASEVFRGGVVAYDNEVKTALLGVDGAALVREGAVSEAVARQMAVGAAELLGSDAGIGITGIAGPDGGTVEKPVGTVWFAAVLDGRVVARLGHFAGDRSAVRERAAQAAFFLLLRLLEGAEGLDDRPQG